MKKAIRILFPLLLLFCLGAAVTVSSSAATVAQDSYYDLWVGGVAVNPANAADVLGDGTVSFDPVTRTLTLSGADIEGYVEEYNYLLSVYCKSGFETNVVIKGTTSLKHGIRLAKGNVTVENADVTFSKNAMTMFRLYGDDSKLTVSNSTIRSYGSTDADSRAVGQIYAEDISMTGSSLKISYSVDAVPCDSIVHATNAMSVVSSTVEIDQKIPSALYALYASNAMTFTDSTAKLSAPMYAFYCPAGTVSFIRSEAEVDRGFYALAAGGLIMEKSEFRAAVFYDGIYISAYETGDIAGEENMVTVKPTEVTLSDSKVEVTQLAYSRLKSMLSDLWDNMDANTKAEYGNSKSTFLEQYASDFAKETVFTAGFSGFCTTVSVLRSELALEKFTLGFYATGTSTLYVSEGSEVKLDAERAAFVLFTNAANAVTVSDSLHSSKDMYVTGISGDLSALGSLLYTYAGKKPTIDLTVPYNEETPQTLFDVLSGISDKLHLYPRSSFVFWLIFGIAGGVLLLGGGSALTVFGIRRSRARKDVSPKKKKNK